MLSVILPRKPLNVLQYLFSLMNNSRMYKINTTVLEVDYRGGNKTEIGSCRCTISVCCCSLTNISFRNIVGLYGVFIAAP